VLPLSTERMADDDSPLLTPEPAPQSCSSGNKKVSPLLSPREDAPLLTPEAGPSPDAGPKEKADKAKRSASDAHCEPEPLQRAESSLSKLGSFSASPSAEKYRRIEKVGVGAYGNVFKAENMETKEIVAIKATFRKEDPMLGGFPLSLLREVCILRRVRHENIVQILEVAQTPNGDPLIVMEFCQASLLELIHSQRHDLSFSEIKYIIRQLLDATGHLHSHGILHRDLATKNVLFNLSGEIKVCDFGISRVGFGQDEEFGYLAAKDLEDPNFIVSLPYRAIELLLGFKRYGPALDIWSVGCIFAEVMLCRTGRRQPFFGGDLERPNKTPEMFVEEIFKILGRPSEDTWPGLHRLPLYRNFSLRTANFKAQQAQGDEKLFIARFFQHGEGKPAHTKYCLTESCFDLLGGLFALCPDQRMTAAEALKHSFFTREKPMPEWHAWHWNMEKQSEIARGDQMKKQKYDDNDARNLLKQLSKEELKTGGDDGENGSSTGKAGTVLEKWQKQAESRKAAAERLKKPNGADEKLPPGWTKHWSSSKQRYYYHEGKTKKNQWEAPKR